MATFTGRHHHVIPVIARQDLVAPNPPPKQQSRPRVSTPMIGFSPKLLRFNISENGADQGRTGNLVIANDAVFYRKACLKKSYDSPKSPLH
jgi:hypothetical protein